MKKQQQSGAAGASSAAEPCAPLGRGDLYNILAVIALAAALRLVFFLLSRHNNPLFFNPIMDGLYHHEWAQRIAAGDFWGDDVFFRAPLYPYLLAGLYKISNDSIAFAIAFQQVLGVASCALIYVLARQFFARTVATIAGVTAALYWPFVYFEGDLLIVTLIVFLDVLGLIALVRAVRTQKTSHLTVAGLLWGLSAIARPNVLLFLLVLPAWFYLRRQKLKSVWWRQSAWLWMGALLVIAPVMVRNFVIGKDIVLIASQGGVNFYIGNNPESDGRTAIVPGTRWDWWGGYQDAIKIAERDRGRTLRPSEVSSYYFKKGLGFVFGSPGESIPLLAKKAYMFWAGGERANNKYIYFFWRQSGMAGVPLPGFWLVAPFGLAGIVLLWRRNGGLSVLRWFLLVYMIGVVAFFVNARFRIPVLPVLMVFGAYAAHYIYTHRRERRAFPYLAIGVLIVAAAAINADFISFKENTPYADSVSHYSVGNAYLKSGNTAGAIGEYEKALAQHAKYPTPGFRLISRNVDYNLGRLYKNANRCEEAVPLLQRVGGRDHFAVIALEMLGDCLQSLGRLEAATIAYGNAYTMASDRPATRDGLIRVTIAYAQQLAGDGAVARATQTLQKLQEQFPNDSRIENARRSIANE